MRAEMPTLRRGGEVMTALASSPPGFLPPGSVPARVVQTGGRQMRRLRCDLRPNAASPPVHAGGRSRRRARGAARRAAARPLRARAHLGPDSWHGALDRAAALVAARRLRERAVPDA